MNRVIKFRIWDAPNLGMYEVDGFDQRFVIQLGGIVGMFNGKTYDTVTDQCVLMQFTGLTDRNGTEWYEGDIIKGDIGTGAIIYDVQRCAFCVDWAITSLDSETSFFPFKGIKYCTVIGNIYQTPELLAI